jgi:S1-C subfamily serine protease
MEFRAPTIVACVTALLTALPLSAQQQQQDPEKLCSLLPPKLGGLDACREAVRKDPQNPVTLGNLAAAWQAVGDQDKALEAYRVLAGIRPDSAEVRLELAKAYDRRGDVKNALENYRAFARLNPDEARARYYVGMMLLELREYPQALVEFRAAAESDSLQGRYQYGVALSLAGLGRQEEAFAAFERATFLLPEDARIWGAAARTAHALGRMHKAVFYWDHAVNVMPSYFDRAERERKQWERAIKEIGNRRVAVINRPIQVQSEVNARRGNGDGKIASFTGSGFWVSETWHLLTNRHVVKGCREVRVRPDSGASRVAVVLATDGHDDLALLKAATPYGSVASFREGRALRRGEDVVAVGFPLNGLLADQVNVTVGTVSSLAGIYNDNHVLQMTAPVQQGNSGGPLFDASGNVIGVVVTKLNARAMAAEIGDFPQNVNFAIKSDIARRFLEKNSVRYRTASSTTTHSNPDIGDMGRVVTVLVECFQ